jgi:hypothetical protein
MRQFAPSTIDRWVEDKLYFDADDALLVPRFVTRTESMGTTGSGSSGM